MGDTVLPVCPISVLPPRRGGPGLVRRPLCVRGQHSGMLDGLVCMVSVPLLLLHQLRWEFTQHDGYTEVIGLIRWTARLDTTEPLSPLRRPETVR